MSLGIGKIRAGNQSHISGVTAYRTGLATGDVATFGTGPTGVDNIATYFSTISTEYAAEMNLNIYVRCSREAGIMTATLQLWFADSTTGPWHFVQTLSVTHGDQLFKIANSPPGYYKVMLISKDSATVDIYYQYRK